ncbi:MAG: helix-turn-helix domain-containing protein [Ginsengibacter sp.]
MVSTTQIKPALILQPFVSCYSLRQFDTENLGMPRPMHAVHEYYMTFFLNEKFCEVRDNSGNFQKKASNSLCTLLTESQGSTYYKGDYTIFCVQFKSNGIFAIFGIPQKILLNAILPLGDILGDENNRLLTEQFESSVDIFEMAKYMNTYLIKMFLGQKHKIYTGAIANLSDIVLQYKGVVPVEAVALYGCMSLRNFERRFINEVGIPPKLYARIIRFYNALENKMLHPHKNWTEITYESGYYDQSHFIKEVKLFSSKSPDELFKYTPPPTESFTGKVDY